MPRLFSILAAGLLASAVPIAQASADAVTDPRLLASQCAQCHGTNGQGGNGIDDLAGEGYNDLLDELREMKRSNDHDVMHYQAKGYTDDQLMLIAWYFSTLPESGNDD